MKKLLLVLLVLAFWSPASARGQKVDTELGLARQATADQGLFFALARNDLQAMLALRNQGANPNASLAILGLRALDVFGGEAPLMEQSFDSAGWPILHWAVFLDNIEAVKLLLRGGALVNAIDIYGGTALHWAAWGGRYSIAKLLLNNGASCWTTDIKHRTPKDWAIMSSQSDMLTLLTSRACRPGAYTDADGDGVPDHQDICPDTPFGAPVDGRGCWVVAYANFFDSNQAAVKSRYLPNLVAAADILNTNFALKVNIEGHTDSAGNDEYNYNLGLRRAEAIKKVLVDNGVSFARISTSSQGKRQPVSDNRSAQGRSLNRRVEIHVIDSGAPPLAEGLVIRPRPLGGLRPATKTGVQARWSASSPARQTDSTAAPQPLPSKVPVVR